MGEFARGIDPGRLFQIQLIKRNLISHFQKLKWGISRQVITFTCLRVFQEVSYQRIEYLRLRQVRLVTSSRDGFPVTFRQFVY